MNGFLAAVCGVLVAGGRRAGRSQVSTGRPLRRPRRPQGCGKHLWTAALDRAVAPTLVAARSPRSSPGVVAAALTGWPLLVALVPAVALRPADRAVARRRTVTWRCCEALDRWVRTLGSLLPDRTLDHRRDPGVGRARRRPCSRPNLRLLTARLDDRWTIEQALLALADELDSADADAVLAALALAAAAWRHRRERPPSPPWPTTSRIGCGRSREIETERAKPRIVVRQVTMHDGGGARPGAGVRRLLLRPVRHRRSARCCWLLLVAAYLGSLLFLRRLTLPRPRQRILQAARMNALLTAIVAGCAARLRAVGRGRRRCCPVPAAARRRPRPAGRAGWRPRRRRRHRPSTGSAAGFASGSAVPVTTDTARRLRMAGRSIDRHYAHKALAAAMAGLVLPGLLGAGPGDRPPGRASRCPPSPASVLGVVGFFLPDLALRRADTRPSPRTRPRHCSPTSTSSPSNGWPTSRARQALRSAAADQRHHRLRRHPGRAGTRPARAARAVPGTAAASAPNSSSPRWSTSPT